MPNILTESLNLWEIADPPKKLLYFANDHTQVVVNTRFGDWTKEMREGYHSSQEWQENVRKYHGFMTHPNLTQFLMEIQKNTKVLVCCQGNCGQIATVVGTIKEISWLDEVTGAIQNKTRNGITARIWLDQNYVYGAIDGTIYSNNVLAITRVRDDVKNGSWRDNGRRKEGDRFIKRFKPLA
jgi:hypothetical protein